MRELKFYTFKERRPSHGEKVMIKTFDYDLSDYRFACTEGMRVATVVYPFKTNPHKYSESYCEIDGVVHKHRVY